jgi:flagellar hook protein FlgE
MGIFGALTTAVSGLKAQSYALENISGNIANSRTTGFKRVDTSFVDLIPDSPRRREAAGSVAAFSQSTNTLQGDLNSTGVGTNIAINGEGFFVVQERTGFAGNAPTFGGIDLYSRRGDFELDRSGYMVNGAGFYLKGIRMDPITQDLIGAQPGVIRVDGDNIPARPTGELEYRANLPARPSTSNAVAATPASWLLAGGPWGPGVPTTITATDETAFLNQTISGGATTAYNVQGAPVNVQLRWGKTSNTSGAESWNAYYQSDAAATGAATKWAQLPGGTFTFDAAGQATSPPIITGLSLTINGAAVGPFSLNTALTQFADADVESKGSVRVTKLSQDGYPSGELTSISIGDGGRVQGNYTNGQVVGLYQLSVAQFSADNGLKRRDGGVFEQTIDSGPPVINDAGRSIVGGTVENSNTDIADEFAKMIVTQQAYSANTKIISTASDMLREVINIVR